MMTIDELRSKIQEIESLLEYTFRNKDLLILAFIHRSFANENKNILQHNERLEFLGDSILGLLISDFLYHLMPDTAEGELSYLRSRLVESASCMSYVQTLNIQSYVLLGKGERMNDGRGRDSIMADLFEAIVGAIYLDGGLQTTRIFLFGKLLKNFEKILETPIQNWKAILQDYCQKRYQVPPEYKLLQESGPDHSKKFTVSVEFNGLEYGRGDGASKKEAQQSAAKHALEKLALP